DLAKNDRRFWRSRSGHLLVFDDTEGAETLQLWDQGHKLALVFDSASNRILLTNGAGDIHVRASTDLYLEAGGDIKWKAGGDIVGESGGKTTHTTGAAYEIEAGSDAKMKAGTAFTLESG